MKKLNTVVKVCITFLWFICTSAIIHVHLLDGLDGVFIFLFESDETLYSKNYSNFKFRKIKIGMTKSEVEEIIGEPLKARSDGKTTIWAYSKGKQSGSYRARVVFFVDDNVKEVIADYVIDL